MKARKEYHFWDSKNRTYYDIKLKMENIEVLGDELRIAI